VPPAEAGYAPLYRDQTPTAPGTVLPADPGGGSKPAEEPGAAGSYTRYMAAEGVAAPGSDATCCHTRTGGAESEELTPLPLAGWHAAKRPRKGAAEMG